MAHGPAMQTAWCPCVVVVTHDRHENLQVWAVIRQLGLSRVAHSFIGDAFVRGLSGGEKRRVSIAVELLTRPGVLLLDEPTTGLDSTNAARVVDIMAAAAAAGVTCVLSIHQPRPDIFRLMHRVLLLSGDGQVVFSGPTVAAGPHFAALGFIPPSPDHSIADLVLDVVIKVGRVGEGECGGVEQRCDWREGWGLCWRGGGVAVHAGPITAAVGDAGCDVDGDVASRTGGLLATGHQGGGAGWGGVLASCRQVGVGQACVCAEASIRMALLFASLPRVLHHPKLTHSLSH